MGSARGSQRPWRTGEALTVDTNELWLTWGFTSQVQTYDVELQYTWQMWRLVPVEVESTFTPVGSLPSYDGDVGKSSTRAEYTESEHDESGVVVNEVTVVTTTVTTHKRYRVENA